MKKLKKLSINPEKLMKNEELISLKGGYDSLCGTYRCRCGFTGGYTSSEYVIKADSLEAALQWMGGPNGICDGDGATCSGVC